MFSLSKLIFHISRCLWTLFHSIDLSSRVYARTDCSFLTILESLGFLVDSSRKRYLPYCQDTWFLFSPFSGSCTRVPGHAPSCSIQLRCSVIEENRQDPAVESLTLGFGLWLGYVFPLCIEQFMLPFGVLFTLMEWQT